MTTAPRAVRHFGLAAMEARAQRSRRTLAPARPSEVRPAEIPQPPAKRVVVRLWLPTTPLFLLLAPFAFLLAPIAFYFTPPRFRTRPLATVLGLGRVLLSLSGTVVHVDTPEALVSIRIF
jgi:hypothetical protein